MSPMTQNLLIARGLIASLPEEDAGKVHEAYKEIIAVLDKYGGREAGHGTLALALIGAEIEDAAVVPPLFQKIAG